MEDSPGPKEKCPPYEFYRFQRHTPKSRWLMAQRVFHGMEPITPELKEVIYACTNCLMCQELCGVRNDGYGPWDITVAMREEITAREGPHEAHQAIYQGLKDCDNPWGQPKAERGVWCGGLGLKEPGHGGATTLLFAGCSADRPSGRNGAVALAKLLRKAGENFVTLGAEESCCGLYAFDLGFRPEFERLKEANLTAIKKFSIKQIIVACGSCQRIWHEYAKSSDAGFTALHAVEYVDQLIIQGRLKFSRPLVKKVTYHDSCHLGRGAGVYDAPRRILRAIPGTQLIEMPRNRRWAWCCGGGGGVPEADPELAQWSAADRLREAAESGAEIVLTSSALCQRSFANVTQAGLAVQDLLEFVDQAL